MVIKRHLVALSVVGVLHNVAAPAPAASQASDPSQAVLSLDSLLSIPINSAAKYGQTASEAPASVSIVTSQDIADYGYKTLSEALSHLRGFYVTNDRNYEYVGVRGLSRPTDYNNRILLLVDGHAVNENVFGSAQLGSDLALPMGEVDYIEVVRGPGSALYGSNAVLAVVNVVTKAGRSINGYQVVAEEGSLGSRSAALTLGRQFWGDVDVMLSGTWGESDGEAVYFPVFDDPSMNHGLAEGLDWENWHGAHGAVRYRDFRLSAMGHSRSKGIPTAPWGVIFNDKAAQSADAAFFTELQFARDVNADMNVQIRGYYDGYRYSGAYPYEAADGGVLVDSAWGDWAGAEVRLRWDPIPANRIQVGSEYRRHLRAAYLETNRDETLFYDDFPFDQVSVHVQNALQVTEGVSITLGLRADHYTDVGISVTPRGALVFHPGAGSTFKLLYGEAFRAPTPWEAFYDGPEFKKNPALRPERNRVTELVWEQRVSAAIAASVSLYEFRMSDLIEETVDPTDGQSLYANRTRVAARGLEAGLDARLPAGLRTYAKWTYQHSKDRDTGAELSNHPHHVLRAGLVAPLPYGFKLAAQLAYDHERLTTQGTEIDEYVLTNVNVSTPALLDRLRVSLSVRNVFNAEYYTPAGFEHVQDRIPQYGRRVLLRLEYTH